MRHRGRERRISKRNRVLLTHLDNQGHLMLRSGTYPHRASRILTIIALIQSDPVEASTLRKRGAVRTLGRT